MMAHLLTRRECWRLGRLDRVNSDRLPAPAQITANAHDRATSADSGNKRVRLFEEHFELPPNFRASGLLVRLDVGAVGELAGEEDVRGSACELFGQPDAALEPALLATDRTDLRPKASD